jgi:hypothetical protein
VGADGVRRREKGKGEGRREKGEGRRDYLEGVMLYWWLLAGEAF